MTFLALIPARGGSKGLPRKNVLPLAGVPLIAWTIRAARQCATKLRVVVTTEDAEIAAVARAEGAEVPFLRPAELSRDDTPGMAPLLHALNWLREQEGYSPDSVVALQPTSPLRTPADIEAAFALHASANGDSVVSVGPVRQHPAWCKTIAPDGVLHDFMPKSDAVRRQDLPDVFALNGAIYLARTAHVLATGSFYTERTRALVMPAARSLDIDTALDLRIAEAVLAAGAAHD